MAKIPLEKGTIKVVWLGDEVNKIYSEMFDDIESAEEFGTSKGDYLIFKLLKHKEFREYSWEVLPYGNYKLYKNAMELYKKHRGKIALILSKLT